MTKNESKEKLPDLIRGKSKSLYVIFGLFVALMLAILHMFK